MVRYCLSESRRFHLEQFGGGLPAVDRRGEVGREDPRAGRPAGSR